MRNFLGKSFKLFNFNFCFACSMSIISFFSFPKNFKFRNFRGMRKDRIWELLGIEEDEEDRISELPIFVIHHIMSYLSTKEVAQTSILSKRWNLLRKSFSVLDFDERDFAIPFKVINERKERSNFRNFRGMGDDRISELPTFIIHHIISYLSTKEVARTSLLSKKWNILRQSFPVLNFDQPNVPISFRKRKKKERQRWREFIRLVEVSLLQFYQLDFRLQKFRLSINLHDTEISSSLLDKWIGLAVEKEVKELDLDVIPEMGTKYTLPQAIFSAKSLTTLMLVGCNLEQPFETMMFYSLKKLTLKKVCIKEEMVQRLTSECPLLEDLAFIGCQGLKGLSVFEAPKLKILTVEVDHNDMNFKSLEIAVPSLQQLTLKRVEVFDITGCLHLKKLELIWMMDLTDQDFHYCISKFPFLEDLSVSLCNSLQRITVSSNRLKNLEFSSCWSLEVIDVDIPNLLSFTYWNDRIHTYSINAPCPWKLRFHPKDDIDTHWFLDMKEFLGVSKQIKDLTIKVMSRKISFDLDEFEKRSDSLPCQVGNLILDIEEASSDYEALLNGFLWICYPKTLSIITPLSDITRANAKKKNFRQWVYEELKNTRDMQCCNHVKCWRHHIKDMKINFSAGEDHKTS